MQEMNEKIIDIMKAVFVVILLTILNVYLPLFSLFILIVWPIPIVLTTIKHGVKSAAIVIMIAALINGLFFSPLMGLMAVIGFGFIGFVLGSSINEEFSPLKILIFTVLAVFISQIIILTISTQFLAYDINQMLDESVQMLMKTPQVDDLVLSQLKNLIKTVLPAILFISSALIGIMNYYITMWYLNNLGVNKKVYRPIKLWSFPKLLVTLGILITLIFSQNTFLLNINVILFFFAFFQGFSVGLYFVNTKGNLLLKILYIFLIFIIPLLPFVLILIGLLDMWFDFRKLKKIN